jgi:hypothetical protein
MIFGAATRMMVIHPSQEGSGSEEGRFLRFMKGVMLYGSENRAVDRPLRPRSSGR